MNADKASALIQSGLENAANFSWERTALRYRDLFTRVLADR
jgi:glycosyltransferase involved in cell wall biosynthesis